MSAKSLTLTALAALLALSATAKVETFPWPEKSFTNPTVERTPTSLVLTMDVNPSAFAGLPAERQVWLRPAVISNGDTLWLSPVIVSGRVRYLQNLRTQALPDDAIQLRAGSPDTYAFQTITPYQSWMDRCELVLTGTVSGCCGHILGRMTPDQPLASCDFRVKELRPTYIYVSPAREEVKVREERGEAYIDFPVAKAVILPDYRSNAAEIAKIRSTIDQVKSDSDITITSITFTGYASPEGSYALNDRLARQRTEALIAYVKGLYHFPDSIMHSSWVAEDWEGLAARVRTMDIADRDALLAIITDSALDPDVRDQRLKREFPQQYAVLLRDVYPSLRHSDYVVTYNIRNYTDVREIAVLMGSAPQKLSLAELFTYAQSLDRNSPEFKEVMEVAVRMYPSDPVANLNAATTAVGHGEYELARTYLAKAGDSPNAAYTAGILAALQGRYAEAQPLLARAAAAGIAEATALLDQMRDFGWIN